jgi:hypothetical protein
MCSPFSPQVVYTYTTSINWINQEKDYNLSLDQKRIIAFGPSLPNPLFFEDFLNQTDLYRSPLTPFLLKFLRLLLYNKTSISQINKNI